MVNIEFLDPSSSAQTPTSGNVFQFSKNSIHREYSGNESFKLIILKYRKGYFRYAKIRQDVKLLDIERLNPKNDTLEKQR